MQFRAGNIESSRLFLEQAVEIYRQGGDDCEPELITTLFIIGNVHKMDKQEEECRQVWKDAFEMSKRSGGKAMPDVHQCLKRELVQAL